MLISCWASISKDEDSANRLPDGIVAAARNTAVGPKTKLNCGQLYSSYGRAPNLPTTFLRTSCAPRNVPRLMWGGGGVLLSTPFQAFMFTIHLSIRLAMMAIYEDDDNDDHHHGE